jgi:hypothetical protein
VPNFFAVMECEDHIAPAFAGERAVRTGLPFDLPAQGKQCCKQPLGLDEGH